MIKRVLTPLALVGLLAASGQAGSAPAKLPALGYVATVPNETPEARSERHALVAARRAQKAVIIVHRGAAAFAPENTLEAYAAAMDYGADGCEVDVRRTADGVLVLFHDDMLDHLTDGFGTVPQINYYQLLSLRPRFNYGLSDATTRPPTFAALLALARQRAMLLHLDVKEPELDGQIGVMLDGADMWDHVTAVNSTTAPTLAKDPRVKPLRFKGPGIYADRKDVDPEAVRAQLAQPGQAIMVDDPRIAARELKRKPLDRVPLPAGLRKSWEPSFARRGGTLEVLVPSSHLRSVMDAPATTAPLLELLKRPDPTRLTVDGSPLHVRVRTERILERAWAAQRLGRVGPKNAATVAALERQLAERTLHKDWMFHGLDGAMAARALGMLRVTESAPALVRAFRRVDPELEKVQNKAFGPYPLAWTDFRVKMYVLPALGELRTAASKKCLQEYLAMDAMAARELGPVQFEDATRALLRQDLSRAEIESLLRSPHSAVRGTAILEYLDHPTADRTRALKGATPWALELPRAIH